MSLFSPRKRDVAQSSAPWLKLVVLVEGRAVGEWDLGPGVWSIGSSPLAKVMLPHSDVRPVHAVLVFEAGVATVRVADADSPALRVNGRTVKQAPIVTGDIVECAHFRLLFAIAGPDGRSKERREEGDGAAPDPQADVDAAAELKATDGWKELEKRGYANIAVAPMPAVALDVRTSEATPGPGESAPADTGRQRAGRCELRLFVELCWGDTSLYRKSFGDVARVVAAADDAAQVPLWGFTLPSTEHVIARSRGDAFEIFVPPQARLDLRDTSGAPLTPASERPLRLERGMSLVMTEGQMALKVRAASAERMPFVLSGRELPWVALTAVALLSGAFGYFASDLPDPGERKPAEPTKAQMVAVRMKMPPPPKPKPEPAVKERKQVKEPQVARKRSRDAAPQHQALASISKLAAITAPASKLVDSTANLARAAKNPMASVGNAPVLANAAPALGGVRGRSTSGAELLHGRVGSLAVQSIGRSGAVQGTVRRASPRSLGVKGSIDRDAVAKVVNARLKEVQACYERALVKSPGLAGKVVLEWTIGTDGTVSSARSKSSTLGSLEVEQCIVRELKGWRFPAAQGASVVITYPFLFNAVGF